MSIKALGERDRKRHEGQRALHEESRQILRISEYIHHVSRAPGD
jgi:hypothetical protein